MGSDGDNKNTGLYGGIIQQIEESLGRALQWLICLLHTNELPLSKLLMHLDGTIFDPKQYSGEIARQIQNCETLPIANFVPNQCILLNIDVKDLSIDQKYLYEICQAISSGDFPDYLANRNQGTINKARWLILINRILRLYASKEDPKESLCILATFIMTKYIRCWFLIKSKPLCKDAARHYWGMIYFSRT